MSRKKQGMYSRRHTLYSRDESTTFVSVYCSGTELDPHAKWRIASLLLDVHDGAPTWNPHAGKYYDPAEDTLIPLAGDITQFLDGDQWVSKNKDERDPMVTDSPTFRIRWVFRCRVCQLAKVVGAPRQHSPWLTILAEADRREVDLRTFARLVDQQIRRQEPTKDTPGRE